MNLDELFEQEEARLRAEHAPQIAAERAAYEALPQAEKDRLQAEADAMWAALDEACEAEQDDEEDEE